jgi:hypothetical protein
MSKYQYHEFQLIDRPLTANEMAELRLLLNLSHIRRRTARPCEAERSQQVASVRSRRARVRVFQPILSGCSTGLGLR